MKRAKNIPKQCLGEQLNVTPCLTGPEIHHRAGRFWFLVERKIVENVY